MSIKFQAASILFFGAIVSSPILSAQEATTSSKEHNEWLKSLFSKQHEALIPKVAVADMFYACNIESNHDFGKKSLKELINNVSKERLAEKLTACLGNESVKSEKAVDFGLIGCFQDQLGDLPENEQRQKIKLVKQAIASLSINEKKKSLSQCVTDQAISYLK